MDVKKKTERDERYLHFLMELYMLASKSYVRLNLSDLLKKHSINSMALPILISKGWVKTAGPAVQRLYHYSPNAPIPTIEIAEDLCDEIMERVSINKATKKQMKNKPIEIKINERKFIPIAPSKVQIEGVSQNKFEHLREALNELPSAIERNPSLSLSAWFIERNLPGNLGRTLIEEEWLKKHGNTRWATYVWNRRDIATLKEVIAIHDIHNDYRQGKNKVAKQKKEEAIPRPIKQLVVDSPVAKPVEASSVELKLEIAKRLYRLGDLSTANEILKELE